MKIKEKVLYELFNILGEFNQSLTKVKTEGKMRSLNNKISDLKEIISIIENSQFHEINYKINNDIICVTSSLTSDDFNLDIFYSKELENLNPDQICAKIISEYYMYISGRILTVKQNCLSNVYMFLYHLGLIKNKIKYTSNYRNKIYSELLSNNPRYY